MPGSTMSSWGSYCIFMICKVAKDAGRPERAIVVSQMYANRVKGLSGWHESLMHPGSEGAVLFHGRREVCEQDRR
jgi:hypothetical protein